jgi:uncharacterized protein YacL
MDASDFVIIIIISKAMTRTMVLIGGWITTMVGTVMRILMRALMRATTPTQVFATVVIGVIIAMLLMFELQELVLQSPDLEQQNPEARFPDRRPGGSGC